MVSRTSSLTEIKTVIKECLNDVYTTDSDILERNNGKGVCERSIVFRLAYYLQNKIPDFFVDCDFNSSYHGHFENGDLIWQQRQGKPIENQDGTTTERFVDIIIHKRHNFQNNESNTSDFLCFEIKKWNNYDKAQIEKDKNNLCIMTSRYGYVYGFFISIHKVKTKTSWTIFQHGRPIEENAVIFNNEGVN